MVAGERFALEGYQEVARLSVALGGGPYEEHIVVVHNHSSHYLVAVVRDGRLDRAEFLVSFFYGHATENGTRLVYAQALARAVAEALRR